MFGFHGWLSKQRKNFIKGENKLNCDGEHAFASEAAIFKVNTAVAARATIDMKPSDFIA